MKEKKIIIITMILNLIVATIKLTSGIFFSFTTLIADSIQSFIDFVTDITSIIVNKMGKRRANKTFPFGYGQLYYFANLLTALLLFFIGGFMIYQFFFFKSHFRPKPILICILCFSLILKFIVVKILDFYGKKFKNELMIEAKKESNTDLISTSVVTVILILSFLNIPFNLDKLGCFGIAIYIFYISIKMMISNIGGIFTKDENNEEIKNEIIEIIKEYQNIELKNIKIIKMATYYSIFLQVKADDFLTIRKYLKIERKIKKELKSKNKLIRFIDIQPV